MTQVIDVEATIHDWWKQNWEHWASKGDPMGDIDNDGVTTSLLAVEYEPYQPVDTPTAVASTVYQNGTSLTQTHRFVHSSITTDTFSWSLSQGLKFGAKATFAVNAPLIGNQFEVTTELNLGATETTTTTRTSTWSWESEIPVSPHTVVVASAVVHIDTYTPTFTARVQIKGISVAYNQSRKGWIRRSTAEILGSVPGFHVESDGSVVYTVKGQCAATLGASNEVTTKESPYTPPSAPTMAHGDLRLLADEQAHAG